MAFRGNNRNRNYGSNNYCGGPMGSNRMGGGNMNMSPWDNQSVSSNFGMGNMRQGVSGGQGMNAQAINLANNLLNNLFRNQNPPSLLDLPRGGGIGNRNQRGGLMVNRAGAGIRLNNYGRRVQGGFQNRGGVTGSGAKPPQKQGPSGIRKPNALDRVKKPSAKNATNKKKDSASGDKKNESKESPYATVSNDMFYCHLCKKHMWDANSFENHIKGRTHLMMREGIEESYRLKANMIRQEAKIAEQLKSIELDRLKRMGKSKQRQLDYCTMCDLNFHGNLSAHRKSEGHLQLKKFLHPKCNECNKEFATRIDYDSHLLSADHLKKAAEKNTKVGERKRNTLNIITEEDELKDVRPPQKKRKKSLKKSDDDMKRDGDESIGTNTSTGIGSGGIITAGDNEKSSSIGDGEKADGSGGGGADDCGEKTTAAAAAAEGNDEAGEEMKECGDDMGEMGDDEELALPVDPDDCIVDYIDGDVIPTEIENRLPKYNWTRPVGAGFISKLVCYECSLCGKFLDVETTAEIHSRTVTHHRNFLKFINEKSGDTKIAQKRAAAALEESERKKRRVEEAEAAATAECDVDVKLENACEEDGIEDVDGGNEELYDPSEATADDEDVEMAENGDDGEVEGEGEGNDDGDWVITEENSNDVAGEMDAQNTEEMAEQPCHGMESTDEVFPTVKVEGGKTAEPLVVANAMIASVTSPTKLIAATATATGATATAAASTSGQPAAAAAGIGGGPALVQATTTSTPIQTTTITTPTTIIKPISTPMAATVISTSLSPTPVATTIGATAVAAAAPAATLTPTPTPTPSTATVTVASNVGALTASPAMVAAVTPVAPAVVPPLIEVPSPTKRTMPNRAVRGSPRGRARGRHNLY